MKLTLTALAMAALVSAAYADDNSNGTFLAPSPHGGYNAIQAGGPPSSSPIFGSHGNASSGTFLAPSPHGGYNVIQAGGPPASIPFFGSHGYATKMIAEEHAPGYKKNFILQPVVIDDGHGKHTVYKKIYFATAEEAEAAKAAMH